MALPAMTLPVFDFNPSSLGVENTVADTYGRNWKPQALEILKSEGFTTPSNVYGFEAGAASLVNALGGGHRAAVPSRSRPERP